MKLKDIIKATNGCHRWLDFDYKWSVGDDGNINISTSDVVNLEDEVEVIYYWYHHMIDKSIRDEIQTAIDNHDYKTFDKYFENDRYAWCLPTSAHICTDKDSIGTVMICGNQEMFNLITYSECECG